MMATPESWPDVVRQLLAARSKEDELVVADWLEDAGLDDAAEAFRSDSPCMHFLRSAISELATRVPSILPTRTVITVILDDARGDLYRARRENPANDLDAVDAAAVVARLAARTPLPF